MDLRNLAMQLRKLATQGICGIASTPPCKKLKQQSHFNGVPQPSLACCTFQAMHTILKWSALNAKEDKPRVKNKLFQVGICLK